MRLPTGPAYLNTGTTTSDGGQMVLVANDDDRLFYHHTGLRGRRLLAVVVCLSVLCILAIIALTCNICIIVFLRMHSRGMRSMQFSREFNAKSPTAEPEHVVHFSADSIDLDTLVSESGSIFGWKERDLHVQGSRVLIRSYNRSQLMLQEGRCRVENVDDMQVLDHNRRPMFSARHPLVHLDDAIKRIATKQLITNKIRAPINENLQMLVDNVSFRGNEGNRFTSKRMNVSAKNSIHTRTTKDGAIRLTSARGIWIGGGRSVLPISSSPSLRASVEGYRLCACPLGRLFIVAGNKPCMANINVCSGQI